MITVENAPGSDKFQDRLYMLGGAIFGSLGAIVKKRVEESLNIQDSVEKKLCTYSVVALSGATLGGLIKFGLTTSWEGTSKGILYGATFFLLGGVGRDIGGFVVNRTWTILSGIPSYFSR